MKKRTIILSAIALIGVLYTIPWFIAAYDVNVILPQMPPPPHTPEAFAEQYPILNAVTWLIRVDLFAAVASGWDALDMLVEINQHCLRNIGISMAITWVCVILLLHRNYAKRWTRALARTTQVLIGILLVLGCVQTAHSFIRHERVVPKWDRKRDQNVLQNHYRFEEMNHDIVVPDSTQGAVLTKSDFGDFYIEVDKRGWLSISGAQVTRAQLEKIVNARASQSPPPRFLLWVDYRCRAEDRDAILSLATNIAPDQVYFVVRDGNHRDMNIVYKGLHYNKTIDIYRQPRDFGTIPPNDHGGSCPEVEDL
jgi:biopolymer transport protein ExbD